MNEIETLIDVFEDYQHGDFIDQAYIDDALEILRSVKAASLQGNEEALEAFETIDNIYINHIEESLEGELPDDDETVNTLLECKRIVRTALQQGAWMPIETKEICSRTLSFMADLNGSFLKGDDVGTRDIRQRAKSLQSQLYKLVNTPPKDKGAE